MTVRNLPSVQKWGISGTNEAKSISGSDSRAREGGSYLVRASLTQSGMLLHRLGRIDREKWWGLERMLPPEESSKLLVDTDTPYGKMTHLAPILQLSETPARWVLPAVPMGTHQPVWLDR